MLKDSFRNRARGPWLGLALVLLLLLQPSGARAENPLPSWREGPARAAIIGFVDKMTARETPGFVPEPERIAVFDNDGTLWPENPVPA